MPVGGYNRGPWYRGGVSRSYVAPSIFASIGCATCLICFSTVLILAGGAMLGISRVAKQADDDPRFDDPFFKEHRKKSDIPNVVGTVGAVLLGIGCTMFSIGIIMCVVAIYLAKRQENQRHADQQNPLRAAVPQNIPPSAYPHQPQSQNLYPPAGSYPTQPAHSGIPTESQYQYTPQPPGYYPPGSTGLPPSGNQYPPPGYTQPVAPNAPPVNSQNGDDFNKQPLEQKS